MGETASNVAGVDLSPIETLGRSLTIIFFASSAVEVGVVNDALVLGVGTDSELAVVSPNTDELSSSVFTVRFSADVETTSWATNEFCCEASTTGSSIAGEKAVAALTSTTAGCEISSAGPLCDVSSAFELSRETLAGSSAVGVASLGCAGASTVSDTQSLTSAGDFSEPRDEFVRGPTSETMRRVVLGRPEGSNEPSFGTSPVSAGTGGTSSGLAGLADASEVDTVRFLVCRAASAVDVGFASSGTRLP